MRRSSASVYILSALTIPSHNVATGMIGTANVKKAFRNLCREVSTGRAGTIHGAVDANWRKWFTPRGYSSLMKIPLEWFTASSRIAAAAWLGDVQAQVQPSQQQRPERMTP